MTHSIQSHHNSPDLYRSIRNGFVAMILQTPFVVPLNRVSIISGRDDCSMRESVRRIFEGSADRAPKSSLTHFYPGIEGHVAKEFVRVLFKAPAIAYKPTLDQVFKDERYKSDLIFGGIRSVAEMFINPLDTVRTMWQAGKKIKDIEKKYLFSHLYKGSLANGVKQFGVGGFFSLSERHTSAFLREYTSLDPHSISGISVKALPQSLYITVPLWLCERIKNELQYNSQFNTAGISRYPNAYKYIIAEQGFRGLSRGLSAKVWSHVVVVVGIDCQLELARYAISPVPLDSKAT